jgi:hypothetical protein
MGEKVCAYDYKPHFLGFRIVRTYFFQSSMHTSYVTMHKVRQDGKLLYLLFEHNLCLVLSLFQGYSSATKHHGILLCAVVPPRNLRLRVENAS